MPSSSGADSPSICGRCGNFTPYNRSGYDETGKLLCASCLQLVDLGESEVRAQRSLRSAGYGSLTLAGVSLFVNPFLIFSILAMLSGGGTLVSVVRSEDHRKLLGAHLVPVIIASAISSLFSLLVCGLTLLGLASMAL
jgi:hypothetical protein